MTRRAKAAMADDGIQASSDNPGFAPLLVDMPEGSVLFEAARSLSMGNAVGDPYPIALQLYTAQCNRCPNGHGLMIQISVDHARELAAALLRATAAAGGLN